MERREREFFALYNDFYYFDRDFELKTYHNEVAAYLVAFLKDNDKYKKYGDIVKSKHIATEDGNVILDLSKSEFIVNNFAEYSNNAFGCFYFKNHRLYLEVSVAAQTLLNKPEMVEALKNYRRKFKGGNDVLKEQTFMRLFDIVQDRKTDTKYVIEGSSKLGNWLGLDKNEQTISINSVLNGIEAGLKTIDETESEKETEK